MPRIRYCVPGNTPGGDGTTTATTGANRGYSTQSEAEAAEQGDLGTMAGFELRCLKGTVADTTNVVYLGWSSNSAINFIQVLAWGDGVHDGTAGSGYKIQCSTGHCIEIQEEYTRIGVVGGGIEVESTSTGDSDEGIRLNLGNSDLLDIYIIGNIIHSTTATSNKDGVYFAPGAAAQSVTLRAYVNIIYGWNRGGIHAQMHSGSGTVIIHAIGNVLHKNGNGTSSTADILGRAVSGTTTINSFNNICASTVSFSDSEGTSTVNNGSNNVTLDNRFNRGNMTAGAQATDGVATTSKTSGAWIVFKNTTAGTEDYNMLDTLGGNLPPAFGADKSAEVPQDILGNNFASSPTVGAFASDLPPASAMGMTLIAQSATLALAAVYVPPPDTSAIEEWFFAEAASGTAPLEATPVHNALNKLTLNYQTNKMNYFNDATGTGLQLTAAAASDNGPYAILENAQDNGDIASKLTGKSVIYFIIVLDLIAGHTNGARLLHYGGDATDGILGITVGTATLELRWNKTASGDGRVFPNPPVGKTIMLIQIDTSEADNNDRVKCYYDNVFTASTGSGTVTLNSVLPGPGGTATDFVVGNRGSANRSVEGTIRYLKMGRDRILSAEERLAAYTGLAANDDISWQTQTFDVTAAFAAQSAQLSMIVQALFNYTAPIENIMTSVLNKVYGTSVSTASPFTFTIDAASNAVVDGARFFVMIEQQANIGIWANVVITYASTGTVMTIVEILETSESDNSMPTFASAVNIFSSVPISMMSEAQEEGRDGILVFGDGNAVGNNGTTLTTTGWSEVLDHVDPNVLTLNLGSLVANATHSATATNAQVTNKYLPAAEPLPHTNNAGLFPPANSVGFGAALGREYFHRQPWSRQTVVLPLGKTAASSFTTGEWVQSSGAMYTATQSAVNTFLAENAFNKIAMIVISLGVNDSAAGANAAFQAALDALINKFRGDAFTGNTLQTDFSKVPVVVCGLPKDFITTVGAAATAIETSLSTTPGRLRHTAFANTDAGYLTDASDYYLDANAQREFAKVIYTAFTNTFTNVVV